MWTSLLKKIFPDVVAYRINAQLLAGVWCFFSIILCFFIFSGVSEEILFSLNLKDKLFWIWEIISIPYVIFLEATPLRSSPSKFILGLVVTDQMGNILTIKRAFLRHFLKIVFFIFFPITVPIELVRTIFFKKEVLMWDYFSKTRVSIKTSSY